MPEVSAAIIVLAGAVLTMAAVIPSAIDEASRQRMAGVGYVVAVFGFVAWLVAFGKSMW